VLEVGRDRDDAGVLATRRRQPLAHALETSQRNPGCIPGGRHRLGHGAIDDVHRRLASQHALVNERLQLHRLQGERGRRDAACVVVHDVTPSPGMALVARGGGVGGPASRGHPYPRWASRAGSAIVHRGLNLAYAEPQAEESDHQWPCRNKQGP